MAKTAFTQPAHCGEVPWKSTVALPPRILMATRKRTGSGLCPSSSRKSSAVYVPAGIFASASFISRAEYDCKASR